MSRGGARQASLRTEVAESRIGANGWFPLGCSAGPCGRANGACVDCWVGSTRRKNNLAQQMGLEPTSFFLTAAGGRGPRMFGSASEKGLAGSSGAPVIARPSRRAPADAKALGRVG